MKSKVLRSFLFLLLGFSVSAPVLTPPNLESQSDSDSGSNPSTQESVDKEEIEKISGDTRLLVKPDLLSPAGADCPSPLESKGSKEVVDRILLWFKSNKKTETIPADVARKIVSYVDANQANWKPRQDIPLLIFKNEKQEDEAIEFKMGDKRQLYVSFLARPAGAGAFKEIHFAVTYPEIEPRARVAPFQKVLPSPEEIKKMTPTAEDWEKMTPQTQAKWKKTLKKFEDARSEWEHEKKLFLLAQKIGGQKANLVDTEYMDHTCLIQGFYDRGDLSKTVPPKGAFVVDKTQTLESEKKRIQEIRLNGMKQMREAVQGIVAFHKENIVHRDVKPGNFLLSRDGRVVLSDFGISQKLKPDTVLVVVGTHGYVPPEATDIRSPAGDGSDQETVKLKGQGKVAVKNGLKADVFAAGIMLNQYYQGERIRFELPSDSKLFQDLGFELKENEEPRKTILNHNSPCGEFEIPKYCVDDWMKYRRFLDRASEEFDPVSYVVNRSVEGNVERRNSSQLMLAGIKFSEGRLRREPFRGFSTPDISQLNAATVSPRSEEEIRSELGTVQVGGHSVILKGYPDEKGQISYFPTLLYLDEDRKIVTKKLEKERNVAELKETLGFMKSQGLIRSWIK